MDFVGLEYRESSAGQFPPRITHTVAVRCRLKLPLSHGLTGQDVQDGAITQLADDTGVSWELHWAIDVDSPAGSSQ